MDRKDFLKHRLLDFFMIQTGISVAVALIGSVYAPDHALPYGAFLMPSVYAFFCTLPTLVTYASKELSIKALLLRKALELFLIALVVLILTYLGGAWLNLPTVLAIMSSVVVIYVLVGLGDYYILKANARQMNEQLRQLQHHMQAEEEGQYKKKQRTE